MMRPGEPPLRSRITGALGAGAVVGLLGLVLLRGFTVAMPGASPIAMQLVDFVLPPPPPPVRPPEPPRPHKPKPKGEAAPPNLVSRATEIVAPEPVVPRQSPVVAAKRADVGSDATSGAAQVAGPGTGAGGAGNGNGGGGDGGGTEFRLIAGDLYDDDYPEWAQDAGISGTVYFQVTIGVNGRVSDCRVTRSVGNARLDELTCRLIKERFRFEPSRDANGRPYVDTMLGEQTWVNQDRPQGSTHR